MRILRILATILLVVLLVTGVSIGGVTLANNWDNITAGQELFTRDQVDRAWSEGWADANAQTLQRFWQLNQRVQDLERQYAETTARMQAEIDWLHFVNAFYRDNLDEFFNLFSNLLPQQNLNGFLLEFYRFVEADLLVQLAHQQTTLHYMQTLENLQSIVHEASQNLASIQDPLRDYSVLYGLLSDINGFIITLDVIIVRYHSGGLFSAPNASTLDFALNRINQEFATLGHTSGSVYWGILSGIYGTFSIYPPSTNLFTQINKGGNQYWVIQSTSALFYLLEQYYNNPNFLEETREMVEWMESIRAHHVARRANAEADIIAHAILQHEITRTQEQLRHAQARIAELS
jgi:hypothetical protein